jgi:DNA-binding transcriptional LysR family regulator
MELRHLKYFMMVAEELHFRKAAEKLFIVQPALSRQIKQLEEELDVQLFNRTKRVVTLTDSGKYFYDAVSDLFLTLGQIKTRTKQIETGSLGKIKIGYVGSAMLSILPKLISNLQKHQKVLHLELDEMTALVQLSMLKEEKIDIGFLRVPREDKEMIDEVVYTENYSVVLPAGHKLNAKNFRGLHQLSDENFILTPRNAGERYFDNIISLCTAAGFSPKIVHESVFEHATIRLVENNMGVSIIPSSFKNAFNTSVQFIELKNIPDKLHLSMVWKKDNSNPSLLTLIELIRKTLRLGQIKNK